MSDGSGAPNQPPDPRNLPDDVRSEALDAVLAVLDQIPGRKDDWMNVKFASSAIDAVVPLIRRHIEIEIEVRLVQDAAAHMSPYERGVNDGARAAALVARGAQGSARG